MRADSTSVGDRAPWQPEPAKVAVQSTRRSLYLTMRDGVRIAVDVHLPEGVGPRPTILRQTRYYRGVELREPFSWLPIRWLIDHADHTRRRFLAAGYAWVDVCVRGSGASFGSRPCPWSPDEIADGGEVVAWIVAQPWCNGRVGSTGVSYDGTAADMLLVAGHPAVRAIAPRFSLFDTYADVAFPGGIHLSWFTAAWSVFNRNLDQGAIDRAFARMLRVQVQGLRAVSGAWSRALALVDRDRAEEVFAGVMRAVSPGVQRVDGDDGRALRAAFEDHRLNYDVHEGAGRIEYRDDLDPSAAIEGGTIDFFSPHSHLEALRASGAAILSYSGWLDAAYQHSAIKRFRSIPGGELIIGPWDHGGTQNTSPFAASRKTAFDHDGELIAFFDRHLRDRGEPVAKVRWFTCGEERWHSGDDWPPPTAPQRWFLAREALALEPPPASVEEHRADPEVGSGRRSRWDSLLGLLAPVGYGDRAGVDRRLMTFRGPPLEAPLVVTGHPVLHLRLSVDTRDAYLFAYLEDEAPDGTVRMVTEGQLRAMCRRDGGDRPYPGVGPHHSFLRRDALAVVPGEIMTVAFDLLPIAWRYGRGHRVRLALAGADRDHFEPLAARPTWVVSCGREGSFLELPRLPADSP
jgi:uncharacterized protein